jgi:hypothetical protein
MAHLASAFVGLWLVLLMPAFGGWGVALIAIPVLMSVAIERMRTIADDDSVTARMMLGSRTLRWTDIEGLRFTKSRWARACRHGQADVVLPAVTFATLPRLTAASGGKVPDPYG